MKHVVKHDLDTALAKRATDKAFDVYREKYSKYQPSFAWATESKGDVGLEIKGVKLKGGVELKPGAIEIEIEVPFLLRPFTGVAMEVVQREIEKWIGKAKAGEL